MLLCFLESQLLQNYVAFPDFGARSVSAGRQGPRSARVQHELISQGRSQQARPAARARPRFNQWPPRRGGVGRGRPGALLPF